MMELDNRKVKIHWDSYSLMISILLGLLGLLGSFFSSQYGFNQFTINIIWSIVLPVLVVLAWGTWYGLLSISVGLTALYPFFLGPYNGWASLVPAGSLYLLILMHGYGQKKRMESQNILYNIYVIQVIYSILRLVSYISFFPLLISFNSSFWNASAYTDVSMEIVLLFAIKGIVVEFILVALGDALLLLPFVRKFFRLKKTNASRANTKILVAMVLFGLTFTFLVLALNQYITMGRISLSEFFSSDDLIRSTFLLAAILFTIMGGITVRYVEKMLETQEALEKREKAFRLANLEIKKLNETLEHRVLKRTEELTQANTELEEFVYTISHDLKSPLRAIDGYGEFLVLDHQGSLDEEASEMVENIRVISQNMIGLINRLLEYSTMAKKELYLEPVNLFTIAEQVAKEYCASHPRREIRLHFQGDNIEIIGDRILLTQVIHNLFSNGIKFAKEEVEFIEITLLGERRGESYYLEFKDEGVGFDNKDEDKVFGMFHRLHKTSEYEGYGIGLSTVRKIIQRHGGQVGIRSKKDEGTTVFFTLPLSGRRDNIYV